ncbi:hypothetical protein ACHQM5_001312 [Ranunculus cassubicifolius]
MKVILKDTDQLVGTVINVFNSGGPNDLLQVQLNPEEKSQDESGSSESGQDVSGHLAWIPFVEAIIPVFVVCILTTKNNDLEVVICDMYFVYFAHIQLLVLNLVCQWG